MFCAFLLNFLRLGILCLPVGSEDPSPIEVGIKSTLNNDNSQGEGEGLGKRDKQWTEILSMEPRAFLYHNFLSKEECDYLIKLAKPHMKRSQVVDGITGKVMQSSNRTSSGTFLKRDSDKVIRDIEKRIADCTFIPVEHGENLQVLHYEEGQKFKPHYDGFKRAATMLMYLSDVEEGGETVFPAAKGNLSSERWLSVKPKMGNALLFWSMKPDGTLDQASLHGGSSVIKGNKWSSTKWLHVGEYKVKLR